MAIFFSIVLLAIGLGILVYGAEWLVKGASSLAKGMGVPALVVGLTIVAFGTSAPELTVNVYAALTGNTDIALGNIVGSNIANILLILGAAALITPLAVARSTTYKEIPFAILAMLLVWAFGNDILLDGASQSVISATDGLAFLGIFAIFMYYIVALAKSEPPADEAGVTAYSTSYSVGLIIIGLAALVFGGRLLVEQAVYLATLVGLSQAVIGLTVVAVGTSLPELATSVVAARKGQNDIAVGNIVGSNIFNVFWILGISALIAPLPATTSFNLDVMVGIAATLLLFTVMFIGKRYTLERNQGIAFIALYVAYVAYLVIQVG